MTFYTTSQGIKAPNDDERVSKGAEAMRGMADSVNAALVQRVSKAGDTMTGQLNVPSVSNPNGFLTMYAKGFVIYKNSDTGTETQLVHGPALAPNHSALLSQVGSSSREFKDNIEPLTDTAVFDDITPVAFDYKPDTDWAEPHDKEVRHYGFIAEDVEAAGLGVRKVADGTVVGLRESELIAVLWAKTQEQEQRIQALEARLGGG